MKLINQIFILIILNCIGTAISDGRTCYSCRGINCLRTSKNVTVKCKDPIDNCITIFEGFEIVARGCYSEIESNLRRKCNDPDHIECDQCNKDLCNVFGRRDYKCVQCNSKDDVNCKNNISKLEPQRCPISSSSNSYCYSKVTENDVVIRGCSSSTKSQNECLNDNNCILCLSGDINNCNGGKILDDGSGTEKPTDKPTEKPGGGGASSISLTMALLILPFLIQVALIPCYKS
ncbi:uncharacterized protein LOC129615763 [Condylostylus longicornis]|uniref:uncharacterized protein LOC129615763 n=1 Tax=Condylostylus longicornis TaxID=2530218 RepID=UPI00244E0DB4|nr:uncharacterized protein LOC129615763 [Condylostylus longicornis]